MGLKKLKIILSSLAAGLFYWLADFLTDTLAASGRIDLAYLYSPLDEVVLRLMILVAAICAGLLYAGMSNSYETRLSDLSNKAMYFENILMSATEYSIATTDLDFRITFYNPMAEKFHGYRSEEVLGHTVQDMHTKEKVAPDRFTKAIENIRLKGEHNYTIAKETPEGMMYLQARVSGIYNSRGELVGYANFTRDITSERLAQEERERLIKELQVALEKVKTLSGLLPICAFCKKIRDDSGYWNRIETYIKKHSHADFTHGICPDCEKRLLKELANH